MANQHNYFRRLLMSIWAEVSSTTTLYGVVLKAVPVLAAFAVQYFRGGFSWRDWWTFAIPTIWTACGIGILSFSRAGWTLYRDDVVGWQEWKSPLIGAEVLKPEKPSRWPVWAVAIASSLFFGSVAFITPRIVPNGASTRQPYPWVSARVTLLGDPPKVALDVDVRDYPPTPEFTQRGLVSLARVSDVQVEVSVPQAFIGPGRRNCVYYFRAPYIENGGQRVARIGFLPLERPVVVVEVKASATNGRWDGYILFRRNGDEVDYEEVLHGTLFSKSTEGGRAMAVKEARYRGKVIQNPPLPDSITDEKLKSFGVPILDSAPRYCPELSTP